MDLDTVTLFFALLALASQIAVVLALVLAVGGRFVDPIARTRDLVFDAVRPQAAALALLVALVSTLGSLYLSEIGDLLPCRLCWIQRGFMYPQVLILIALLVTRARWLWWVVAGSVTLGGAVSIYHVLIERFPDLESDDFCDVHNKCSTVLVEHLGYLTIPTMALSGFALLFTLAMIGRSTSVTEPENQ